jgi:hypothetical protein
MNSFQIKLLTYQLQKKLFKTTDDLRNIRLKHRICTHKYKGDLENCDDKMTELMPQITKVEQRHISAITEVYEKLPRAVYEIIKKKAIIYAHRDDKCGCCNIFNRMGPDIEPAYQPNSRQLFNLEKTFCTSKHLLLKLIRTEHINLCETKNNLEFLINSQNARRKYIFDRYYQHPYIEPYNICLFWNVEYSYEIIDNILDGIADCNYIYERQMEEYHKKKILKLPRDCYKLSP